MRTTPVFVAALISAMSFSVPGAGRNLTPLGQQNLLLTRLEPALERMKVDVRSDHTRRALPTKRAVLSPLAGLPMAAPEELHPQLERDFNRGAFGFLAAIAPEASGTASAPKRGVIARQTTEAAEEFHRRWSQAPPENRIFLSFTRADRATARRVSNALAAQGYTVFSYLNPKGETPFSVEEVGSFFRTAGERYVLDTPATRSSQGVWIELAAENRYRELASVEQAFDALERDRVSVDRWFEARKSPFDPLRERRTFDATRPLAWNLFQRAATLDRKFEAWGVPRDSPERAALSRMLFFWRNAYALNPELAAPQRSFDSDLQALIGQRAEFQRTLKQLQKDPAYPTEMESRPQVALISKVELAAADHAVAEHRRLQKVFAQQQREAAERQKFQEARARAERERERGREPGKPVERSRAHR